MTSQKIAIGLVAVCLVFWGCNGPSADFDAGEKAIDRGDYATALRIFRQLADQGDTKAQHQLGIMYDYGIGLPQDSWEAMKWYYKAALQGNAKAQIILGNNFSLGSGVLQDKAEAVKWYRKAADQGIATAQESLGVIYSHGVGVTQDYVQAHMWYNLAAMQGWESASKYRDNLTRVMTPSQIAEAQKLAREWKPKGK